MEYSLHAVRQMIARDISPEDVVQTIQEGAVIEDYPKDKYGPSCLVLGRTVAGRALHIQCSHPSRPLIKIITAYEPDITLWHDDLRTRRAK